MGDLTGMLCDMFICASRPGGRGFGPGELFLDEELAHGRKFGLHVDEDVAGENLSWLLKAGVYL